MAATPTVASSRQNAAMSALSVKRPPIATHLPVPAAFESGGRKPDVGQQNFFGDRIRSHGFSSADSTDNNRFHKGHRGQMSSATGIGGGQQSRTAMMFPLSFRTTNPAGPVSGRCAIARQLMPNQRLAGGSCGIRRIRDCDGQRWLVMSMVAGSRNNSGEPASIPGPFKALI